jgi:cyclic pyranopterin phosphate synthase
MSIPIALAGQPGKRTLIDAFFRTVTYLRVSVTDRCDLRCVYCMSPDMAFLPKKDLLTLDELDRVCSAFIARGVRKLRLTGGEPLMRRGFLDLVRGLSRHLKSDDLQELTLTTNGTRLSKYAADLAAAGVRRINVSLDTLDADAFRKTTRGGNIKDVLEGIAAAQDAGLKVKINTGSAKRHQRYFSRVPGRVVAREGHGHHVYRNDAPGRYRRGPDGQVCATVARPIAI